MARPHLANNLFFLIGHQCIQLSNWKELNVLVSFEIRVGVVTIHVNMSSYITVLFPIHLRAREKQHFYPGIIAPIYIMCTHSSTSATGVL